MWRRWGGGGGGGGGGWRRGRGGVVAERVGEGLMGGGVCVGGVEGRWNCTGNVDLDFSLT